MNDKNEFVTREKKEFEYYCLDRLKPLCEEFPVSYKEGGVIKKLRYKVGLRASIKHEDCFILYTESDDDLERFTFIRTETFYNYQKKFYTETITVTEMKEVIETLPNINIFEFTSLLNFINIYSDFKDLIENNLVVSEKLVKH